MWLPIQGWVQRNTYKFGILKFINNWVSEIKYYCIGFFLDLGLFISRHPILNIKSIHQQRTIIKSICRFVLISVIDYWLSQILVLLSIGGINIYIHYYLSENNASVESKISWVLQRSRSWKMCVWRNKNEISVTEL